MAKTLSPAVFNKAITQFQKGRSPDLRYASFDYCYSYFHGFENKNNIAGPDSLERSCFQLAFYLASWGMFRGSSFLLQRSARFFAPLVKWIAGCDADLWTIDVPDFAHAGPRKKVLRAYESIERLLGGKRTHPSKTLITKVMLGVFANIPALDQYFCKAFHVHTVNDRNLTKIHEFYVQNRVLVDSVNIRCFAFGSGKQTGPMYSRAKVIDMYGFIAGNKQ